MNKVCVFLYVFQWWMIFIILSLGLNRMEEALQPVIDVCIALWRPNLLYKLRLWFFRIVCTLHLPHHDNSHLNLISWALWPVAWGEQGKEGGQRSTCSWRLVERLGRNLLPWRRSLCSISLSIHAKDSLVLSHITYYIQLFFLWNSKINFWCNVSLMGPTTKQTSPETGQTHGKWPS